jgi:hypothetical protein
MIAQLIARCCSAVDVTASTLSTARTGDAHRNVAQFESIWSFCSRNEPHLCHNNSDLKDSLAVKPQLFRARDASAGSACARPL